jgi:nucleotide-binding universal stress UspA family protein
MSLVVGLPRDERATAALHLGGLLARALDEELVVVTAVPPAWPPGVGRIDAEYQEYLDQEASLALDAAREVLSGGVAADYVISRARSAAAGLVELAQERRAAMIVLGSSSAGVLGRVAFGSVAERLLHTAPVPVALAPRGFRAAADAPVEQVTVAFGGAAHDAELVVAVAGVAARAGAALRVASFGVLPRTPLTAGVGSRAEDTVVEEWATEIGRAQRAAMDAVAELPAPPATVTATIGRGHDWASALESIGWGDTGVLAVGSSSAGPLERVFLGSRSSRIVRHSPVPVIVVPRGGAGALAARADDDGTG